MSNSRFNQNQTVNMSTSYHQQSQHQSLNLSLRPGDKISIPAQELSGLVAWLRMTTKVAQFNEIAAMRFSDDPAWTMCSAVASLSTSSVPLALKAALIDLLTAVARLKGTAPRIWQVIHVNQLCYHADGGTLMGMQQELEERECIAKQYDVSLAFVKLMTTLLMHRYVFNINDSVDFSMNASFQIPAGLRHPIYTICDKKHFGSLCRSKLQ